MSGGWEITEPCGGRRMKKHGESLFTGGSCEVGGAEVMEGYMRRHGLMEVWWVSRGPGSVSWRESGC